MGLLGKYGVSIPGTRWYNLRHLAPNEDTSIDAHTYELLSYTAPISAGSSVLLPASNQANHGKYVGIQINTVAPANGVTVDILDNGGTPIGITLYVEGQTVWLGYDHTSGKWEVIAREDPAPGSAVRLSPFAAYLMSGADADLTDLSGNGRTLTKVATAMAAPGLEAGEVAGVSGVQQAWTRADANFRIMGAFSMEFLAKPIGNAINGSAAFYMFMGSGAGGAANNRVYSLGFNALTAALNLVQNGWRFTSQHGANVDDTFQANVGLSPTWAHVAFTRSADVAGLQTVKSYINGILSRTGTITTTDSSTTTAFTLGGANAHMRYFGLWDSVLTDLQIAYLARYRLGRLFRT